MILSMSGQTAVFLTMAGVGLCAGFIYDIIRIFRFYIKHMAFVIHLEDLFYWVLMAGAVFYIFLNRNYGDMRAFCVLGTGIGMILYFLILSPVIMLLIKSFITLVARLAAAVFAAALFPIKLLYKPLKRPLVFLKKIISERCEKIKKVLRNFKNYAKIKGKAKLKEFAVMIKKV